MRPAILVAVLGLLGCEAAPAVDPIALADGTQLDLRLEADVEREERDDGVRLRSSDGWTVTVQEVPREVRLLEAPRSAQTVAEALVSRVTAAGGEVAQTACRAAGRPARCVDGTMSTTVALTRDTARCSKRASRSCGST